jgi:hypothetical protein
MKGNWITYSAEEIAWLDVNRTLVISEYHRAFCEAFGRHDISAANLHALRKRKGWKTGRTGCFPKGGVPANKGQKMPFNPNSARTQFKKGQRPHNTNYLGHERITKDGYIEISVDERNPHTGFERRYVQKHRYLWEKINGPVPEGMFLKCLDTNRQNTDPANWELMPRAAQVYIGARFGINYEAAEPEVRPAIIKFAKLKHAAKAAKSKTRSP